MKNMPSRIINSFATLIAVVFLTVTVLALPADKLMLKVVSVDSEETAGEDGHGSNAVDGNPATLWHTQWQDASPGLPHQIIIELSRPAMIGGFTYLQRQDDSDHGGIADYEFFVSEDGKTFSEPAKKGSLENNKGIQTVSFTPRHARFIKLVALSEVTGEAWTSAAEIGVIEAATTPVLVHRYSFNGDARDLAGEADGTLQGEANISSGQLKLNGTPGTCLSLPGGLIAGCDAVTFEFWVTLGANKSWARVFDQGSTNGNKGGHDLYFSPHSGLKDFRLTIMDPHPNERVVTVPGNLDNQTNLHVACVLDPGTGFMGLYTNGELAASRTDLKSLTGVDTNLFFLGKSLFAGDATLNGSIDEFRIFNGVLSAADIAAHHQQGPDAIFTGARLRKP